jgi:hypothetical protein
MNIDSRLLANMIASGIYAAGETLNEPLDVTIHENAAIVYVATRDRRLFRIRVEPILPAHGDEGQHAS